ncbi:MAG: hypothetical protein Q8936_19845 [Bacillota bacterium]|nr:hypothetical protein [Bacillota bacterium]
MKYDKFLIVVSIGAVSTIPGEILSRVLIYFGIGKYSIYELASLLITFNRPTIILGLIVDFTVSGVVATLLYLVLGKIGSKYLVIKTLGGSLLAWFVTELLFTSTIEGKYIPIRPISDYYCHIFGAVAFGVTLGVLFKRFIFKKLASI